MKEIKNQKTKYKGVYFSPQTGKYLVQTTFTTKDGIHIKKCKRGFDTAKKAELWKTEQALHYSQTNYSSEQNSKCEFDVLLENYLNYRKNRLKMSTLTAIKMRLTKYLSPFFPKEAKMFGVKEMQAFYDNLYNVDVENQTKNMIISTAIAFIEWLDLIEAIEPDVLRKFKRLVVPFDESADAPSKENTFEETEVVKILNSIGTDTKNNFRFKVLFTILASTGCRLSEALALKFEDVDYVNNTIHFCKQTQQHLDNNFIKDSQVIDKFKDIIVVSYTKTNSTKTVLVNPEVIELIMEFKRVCGHEYIFQKNDKMMKRWTANNKLKSILNMLGLPHRSPHAFRHYHTTMLYQIGCDPKYVAERLGHSNELTSINVYKHLTKKQLDENDKLISKLLI